MSGLVKSANVTRRSLVAGSVMAAAACTAPLTHAFAANEIASATAIPTFLVKPDPISDFAEEFEFDVVVVGAGESGLSAVHSALAAGATVACLQNADAPFTTGNMSACVDLDQTSAAGQAAIASFINWKSDYRSDRDLVNMWIQDSWEAVHWWADAAESGGVESKPYDYSFIYNGYEMFFHANTYFHVDGNHNAAAAVIAAQEEAEGARFFYATPAVQLQTGADGGVDGVIGQRTDGSYILVKATKGVILCTGDYTGNTEMADYYCPDTKGFEPGVMFRDGSGMAMGMWAGAVMMPPNHTKMIHGEPAPTRLEMPFLFVNTRGERFMDESCGGRMGYLNNYQRKAIAEMGFQNPIGSKLFSIVPNNWQDYVNEWKEANPYEISVHNAYRDVNPEKWIQADTPEELAEAINAYMEENDFGVGPMDPATFAATLQRYNELCAAGSDDDFGKDARYMVPCDSAPYYACIRGSHRKSSILAGLVVDKSLQCLDGDMKPIRGLYAAGNASGGFYGGVDYPMNIEGLSIGRAVTTGYVAGRLVAGL